METVRFLELNKFCNASERFCRLWSSSSNAVFSVSLLNPNDFFDEGSESLDICLEKFEILSGVVALELVLEAIADEPPPKTGRLCLFK